MTNISADEINEWAGGLTVEKIKDMSDEEILKYRVNRPEHPGQYGFMLNISYFKSTKHLSEISHALMERLRKVDGEKADLL